ncbi:hypothetical protein [Alkalicoccus halolimnae]|uniref:Uncharacterized protein n=1 Tax=Alkalicoccus halolimnae TaxID=1667239 RepID=A0A5C7F9T0_9BACI|nr:hypothetical protein [Alkalicoccus halolimnae]TXF87402.1 hypothetical protein FTX54_01400 [Alkalicoccus halolimnae]
MLGLFPAWIWITYFILMTLTLAAAGAAAIRRESPAYSLFAAGLVLVLPLFLILFLMGRPVEEHELVFLWRELRRFSFDAIFLVFLHLYLIVWWMFIIFNKEPER